MSAGPSLKPMPDLEGACLGALADAAREAAKAAYAPYSRFPVGAAVLAADGSTHSACNVENASYGLSICAERAAVFKAVAAGCRQILAVAVYTPTPTPTAPCGACRQVIYEFGPGALLDSRCSGPEVLRARMSALLPTAFEPGELSPS